MTKVNLTFEEFYTLLVQVAAVLNLRALVPLSRDPNDLQAISPGHFIIGEMLTSLPETDFRHGAMNFNKSFLPVRTRGAAFLGQVEQGIPTSSSAAAQAEIQKEHRLYDGVFGADGEVRVVTVRT
ncbi:hypothetical protein HUJ04_012859 [Dendroctonus ponderosae]|nr:hypothetical protein HUJ04_012859 [Dendroctonus ponderosae]KAH1016950.1 hypothetical protein HUJ05_007691 [Dendroctonus ponderosae]